MRVRRSQLRGERADQNLVGIGIDVDLLTGKGDSQVGGMGTQFSAG